MSKKQKAAGYPGHGKSKIMKKLKRKYKEWLRWATPNGEVNPVMLAWMDRFPSAMAALRDDGQSENPYIYQPKKMQDSYVTPRSLELASNILMLDDVKTDRWLVEDLDTNATCWDDQMGEMCRDFHTLRDRLVIVQDNDRLKLVDELLHRVIEVRCQLNTMKKEQSQ